jgi:hypothetical protein
MQLALPAHRAGADRLRQVLTGMDDECTWVECDSGVGGLLSVNNTSSEQCSYAVGAGLGV